MGLVRYGLFMKGGSVVQHMIEEVPAARGSSVCLSFFREGERNVHGMRSYSPARSGLVCNNGSNYRGFMHR